MSYSKTFSDYPDLIAELRSAGLQVPDEIIATRELKRVGYHRLGGYRYPLREKLPQDQVNAVWREFRKDSHIPGSTLDHVIAMESFDRELQGLLAEGLMEFEIRLRNSIVHVLSARSVFGYSQVTFLDASVSKDRMTFDGATVTKFDALNLMIEESVKNAMDSGYDAVDHHVHKYGKPVPLWTAMEVLSFGKLPYILELLKQDDANAVAVTFGVSQGDRFNAWTRALVDLRNLCAHGSRVFNRSMKRSLKVTRGVLAHPDLRHIALGVIAPSEAQPKKLYAVAAALAYMLKRAGSDSDWNVRFRELMLRFPAIMPDGQTPVVSPELSMGFPGSWAAEPLWTS